MNDHKWISDADSDLELFKELFNKNGSSRTIEHLKWQYVESCSEKGRLILSGFDDSSNSLTGVYALFQSRFICDSKELIGSQSLDTLVAPESRGKGLFNKFACEVYGEAADRDVAFVYGFPNGSSAHGFFNKLSWKKLDPVPFIILPINSNYILSRLPLIKKISRFIPNFSYLKNIKNINNLIFSKNVKIDSKYDALWSEFSKKIKFGINRDSQYVNWRLARPDEEYKNLVVFDSNNKMIAICFYILKNKHGGSIGYILDLLYLDDGVGAVLLNQVLKEFKEKNCDAVLAWNFEHSPNHTAYKKNGFFSLPEKLRPIELHFGVRVFNENIEATLTDRSAWYLSYFDSDSV